MNSSTLTIKGQVTIPKHLRDCLGLSPGDKVGFEYTEDGAVRIVAPRKPSHGKCRKASRLSALRGTRKTGMSTDEIMNLLRGYALSGGAEVIGATALTGKGYSAKLALSPQTLHSLRDRYGKELESWWRQSFGYGFDKLTESEARYLLRAENAHTIRDRMAQARPEAKP